MMMSSKPSPLTSPAEATLQPALSLRIALDDEAVARRQGGKVDVRQAARLAEDDVGLAGIATALVPLRARADDQVVA